VLPNLKKGPLSAAEQELFQELYGQYGTRWSEIAKRMPGRTHKALKHHYHKNIDQGAKKSTSSSSKASNGSSATATKKKKTTAVKREDTFQSPMVPSAAQPSKHFNVKSSPHSMQKASKVSLVSHSNPTLHTSAMPQHTMQAHMNGQPVLFVSQSQHVPVTSHVASSLHGQHMTRMSFTSNLGTTMDPTKATAVMVTPADPSTGPAQIHTSFRTQAGIQTSLGLEYYVAGDSSTKQEDSTASTNGKGTRRRRKKKPLILPLGWRMVERTSQKCKYKTYVSPQGKSFRSLAQVYRYLEKQALANQGIKSITEEERLRKVEEEQRSLMDFRLQLIREAGAPVYDHDNVQSPPPKEITVLLTHTSCLKHETAKGHLESPLRLRALLQRIALQSYQKRVEWRSIPSMANLNDIQAVHHRDYVSGVLSICDMVDKRIFPHLNIDPPFNDTMVAPGTREALLYAAGSVVAAVDALMLGRARNAFCAVRPPGHHSNTRKPMGFCIFNHIAIGASYAKRVHKIKKVAIVDFDVHHGNGTQEIFKDDPSVFCASIHRLNIFPFTGAHTAKSGFQNMLNLPVQSRQSFLAAVATLLDALEHFQPEFIFISAGFGGHREDIHSLDLSESDFDALTEGIIGVAERCCGGRVVSVLEGGYSPDTLAKCAASHLYTLSAPSFSRLVSNHQRTM
jgi:acetoin utilization deacetylase AcuC-like enzyme